MHIETHEDESFGHYITQLVIDGDDIVTSLDLANVDPERFTSRYRKKATATVQVWLTDEAAARVIAAFDEGTFGPMAPGHRISSWGTEGYAVVFFTEAVSYRGLPKSKQFARYLDAARRVNARAYAYTEHTDALQAVLDKARARQNKRVADALIGVYAQPARFRFEPMPEVDEPVQLAEATYAAARAALIAARAAQHKAQVDEVVEYIATTDDPIVRILHEDLTKAAQGSKPVTFIG